MKMMFALNDHNNDQFTINKFEELLLQTFKDEDVSFRLDSTYHCPDKHALLRIANEANADLLIVNEGLPGDNKPLIDVLKEVRTLHPDMQIILLLTKERQPGDAFMSDLVDLEIYDWFTPKWNVKNIYKATKEPKRKKDVEEYVTRKASSENTSYRYYEDIMENNEYESENKTPAYTAVLPMGVSEGIERVDFIQSVPDVNEKPISFMAENEVDHAQPNAEKNKEVAKPVTHEAEKKVESVKEEKVSASRTVLTPAQRFAKEKKESETTSEKANEMPDLNSEEEIKKLQAIREEMESVNEVEPVQAEKTEEVEVKTDAEVEKVVEEDVKPAPKVEKPKTDKFVKKVNEEKKVEKTETKPTSLNFHNTNINANKILILRALPLVTYLPSSILEVMKKGEGGKDTVYIDLNKTNNKSDVEGVIYSSIKEGEKVIKKHNRALIEVVAGNGVEKIIPLVDRVILVTPQDLGVIKTCVDRYGELLNNKPLDLVIEKGIFGDLGIPQIKENINVRSATIIRVTDADKANVITSGEFKDVMKGAKYIDFESGVKILEKLLESLGGE